MTGYLSGVGTGSREPLYEAVREVFSHEIEPRIHKSWIASTNLEGSISWEKIAYDGEVERAWGR